MPASNKMFVEQSNLTMPSSVWLHVNGVSLTADIHPYQPPTHTYDYRTKHLQSPVQSPTPPLISTPTFVPYSITMIDGPYSNKTYTQYQKLENVDIPKKIFIDRQIKKAKSLPGLIKGTALSRHTPLQSLTFTGQTALNPSVNNIQEDQLPNVTLDNDDESFSLPRTIEQQHEIRRPRVYFADFNKVQFIEGNKDTTQQYNLTNNNNYRHHRRRTSRKTSNKNRNNYVSPSIQQTQVLHNGSSPLSYQSNDQIGQELNIKKQPFFVSQRAHSSRLTYLPDIMNSSSVIEHSSNENFNDKYVLQREKPLIHLPKSVHDISLNSSLDITPEDKCNDVTRSSPTQDTHDRTHECELSDYNSGTLAHGISSVSSTSNNRQRALLRKISLRQQFNSSIKIKATGIGISTNNTHLHHHQQRQQITYTKLNLYQSTSNKHSISRMHDNNDDFNSNGRLLTIENRPMTGPGSVKNFKHSDIIHFTSKSPLRGNTINDTNEISRYFNRSRSQESTHERFENVLTVVRPPYASVMGTTTSATPNDLTEQTMYHNQTKRNLRSSHETLAFHVTSNTITV